MNTPTFCVAGAGRAGTTAIIEALRRHEDVFVTRPKEPHYFAFAEQEVRFTGPYDETSINQVAVTDRDRYLALFDTDRDYLAFGEGSVSTLYHHRAAIPTIREINPAMRVIIMLRDPVERAFSSHQYLRARGFEPVEDFRAAIDAEASRVQDGWQHLFHYTQMSYYADAVEHFIRELGPDQVGLWDYEDVVADGPAVLRQICAFLGLDPARLGEQPVERVNVSGQPRSPALQALMRTASRSRARSVVKKVVPFGARERIRRANLQAYGVPADIRAELSPMFADDLARLSDIVGHVAPAWSDA